MSIEAMKQALYVYLNAFENHQITNAKSSNLDMTGHIAELARTAIEQSEERGEPVAWMDAEGDVYRKEPPEGWCPPHIPLYAHTKREWVGLTDEEFDFLVPYCHNEFDLNDYKEFARDIEAKIREKNGL
jgi:hypothetical protein